jgi:transposase-like protein
MECAPGAGQVEVSDLTGVLGFRKMKAMARQQRSHSIEFKRQVVQEYIAGETLYGLAKRHDLSRQLIRVWVEKYEAGGLDADAQAADLLHEYETKIAALELMGHDLTSSFELICAITSKLSFVLGSKM